MRLEERDGMGRKEWDKMGRKGWDVKGREGGDWKGGMEWGEMGREGDKIFKLQTTNKLFSTCYYRYIYFY